jgi:hypothetical protein
MNIQDMQVVNAMKQRVKDATKDTIGQLSQEIPTLIEVAEHSPREPKLELLELSRSVIDKLQELFPNVVNEEGWQVYVDLHAKLSSEIMSVRFAIR